MKKKKKHLITKVVATSHMPSPPPDGQETAAVESPSLESSGDVHLVKGS